ncbi:hypothetical protein LCGC14_2300960, partial [marine sediment metagenome]
MKLSERRWRKVGVLAGFLLAASVLLGRPVRGEQPLFRFAASADTHIAEPREMLRFRRFLHTIKAEKVDFLLMLGDLCAHAPEYLPQIKEVADLSGLKVHAVSGNHDDNYARNPEWYRKPFGRMYYSFEHKGVHFVMNWSQSQPTEWVKKALAAVPPDRPIIFCQHYPPTGRNAEGELAATLAKYPNVKLILSGHTHRHADKTLGGIRSVTLGACNFSPQRRRGDYYIGQVYRGGRVTLEAKPLAKLKLLAPADGLPTVELARPATGDVLSGKATFRGTAADDRAVRAVQYSVDLGPWRPGQGTAKWSFTIDTAKLTDDHHTFRVRAVDSAGQASLRLPTLLCLVANRPPAKGRVFRFQQGLGGYAGCTDVTVRRHRAGKSPSGADGELIDLENWLWKAGEGEFAEFYIRFDLSRSGIPADATIKRVTLT